MPLISSGLTIMALLDDANRGFPEDRIPALEKVSKPEGPLGASPGLCDCVWLSLWLQG